MERIHTTTYEYAVRDDGQRCPIEDDKETGEKKVRSSPFYAFNQDNFKSKVQLAMKNPVANSIFDFFVSEMDNTNAICVSMATLEELFGMKRNALSKYIKYLEAHNFISIFKIGNMNAYAVNAYVVWTQGDANIWKAKFSATMYLNYDEQTPKVKQEFSKRIKSK